MTQEPTNNTILLVGESGVGKTHFGAQLLGRLVKGDSELRMNGAATNIEPFESALESLNEGRSAGHTPTATYVDSVWPVIDKEGKAARLIWPDYGGEQVKAITATRTVSQQWRERIISASAWLLFVRLQATHVADDIFSKPLKSLKGASTKETLAAFELSDQARLIELLQILLYVRSTEDAGAVPLPRIAIALTCWDEAKLSGSPREELHQHLPMLSSFVLANWADPHIVGLSALGKALDPSVVDDDYVAKGPEHFGFVVSETGTRTADLTLPIQLLISETP